MRYNEEKFNALREESRNKNAALLEISDRRREAKTRLDQLQVEVGNAGRNPSRELEITLRHARTDYEGLVKSEERSAQAWQEAGAIVRKCEEFLAEKGIRLDGITRSTVNH